MVRANLTSVRWLISILWLLSTTWPLSAAAGGNPPIVINSTQTARPGDIVGFQGEEFGDSPTAVLEGIDGGAPVALERVNAIPGIWASFRLPPSAQGALIVRLSNSVGPGAPIKLNAASPFHLDTTQLAAGGKFRIFGRNLLMPGVAPVVKIDGSPATVDETASDENMLLVTAPPRLATKTRIGISVDNGNGTGASLLDRTITAWTGEGKDTFGLGVGWADAFSGIASKVLQAASDPRLQHPMKCNGAQDDSRGLQESIDLASAAGGGTVLLPEGSCRLAASVQMKSHVVVQGAGPLRTVLLYDASYPFLGRGISLAGLRDFSLRNVSGAIESALLQKSDRVFFQNVVFEINGGLQMFLTDNRNFVIDHCEFLQPKNPRESGPFVASGSSGLVFTHNRIVFANGNPNFGSVHDSYIGDNHISRDVRDNQNSKGVVHSLTLDFSHHVAVLNNVLDIVGGPIVNKRRNDGETILTEGGGGNRTENIGYVVAATALTLTDPGVVHKVRPFGSGEIPENYAVAIVGGKGAGQARRVVSYANSTLTVDRAWDIIPDASSHYATFVWGLEKTLIKGNTLSQNSRGIWLYQTAVKDVDIVSNTIQEGGGIYLRTAQNLKDRLFTPMYGVRIANNTISNTSGEWPSYVHLAFVRMGEPAFGLSAIGVEVRANTLLANHPNVSLSEEESGGVEGFIARARFEGDGQGRSTNQPRLLGTIFQDNRCTGCNTGMVVREGAYGTVQDGNTNTAFGQQQP